jgi:D-sedoheptulose 7-phosphate isomerase
VKDSALSDPDESTLLGYARDHLLASAETKRRYAETSAGDLVTVARWIAECFARGGKLMLCGNGGSAADCQHIAAEFTSILTQTFNRRALPAIALTTDTSFLTARGNDYGFDSVFSRQVEALGKPGDVLVGSSTSGNSNNVLLAFETARRMGLRTIGMTGRGGGKMIDAADLALRVPADVTAHIQECHIAMGHVIVAIVEKYLFNSDGSDKPFGV